MYWDYPYDAERWSPIVLEIWKEREREEEKCISQPAKPPDLMRHLERPLISLHIQPTYSLSITFCEARNRIGRRDGFYPINAQSGDVVTSSAAAYSELLLLLYIASGNEGDWKTKRARPS